MIKEKKQKDRMLLDSARLIRKNCQERHLKVKGTSLLACAHCPFYIIVQYSKASGIVHKCSFGSPYGGAGATNWKIK